MSDNAEAKIIWMGVEVVMSTDTPPQKIFMHPFTFSNLLERPEMASKDGIIDIQRGGLPDPLRPDQQTIIDSIEMLKKNRE